VIFDNVSAINSAEVTHKLTMLCCIIGVAYWVAAHILCAQTAKTF